MNQLAPFLHQIARFSPMDVLLADVAVRIQLSPTEYLTAVQHYQVMGEWIDRAGSSLRGLVEEFYPQGGFSTGSTVASHADNADFDLDAMARINWTPRTTGRFDYIEARVGQERIGASVMGYCFE